MLDTIPITDSYKTAPSRSVGLPLQDPSYSSYISALAEHRHLPDGRDRVWAARHRRRHNVSGDRLRRYAFRLSWHSFDEESRLPKVRPHQLASLPAGYERQATSALTSNRDRLSRGRHRHVGRGFEAGAEARDEEAIVLARSWTRLPSDVPWSGSGRAALRRTPSLEREDAFRDATTAKSRTSSSPSPSPPDNLDDCSYERGSDFGLDSIVHDEPLYTLHVRPAGNRGRKRKAAENLNGYRADLPLDLSFAALGDDEAIARLMVASRCGVRSGDGFRGHRTVSFCDGLSSQVPLDDGSCEAWPSGSQESYGSTEPPLCAVPEEEQDYEKLGTQIDTYDDDDDGAVPLDGSAYSEDGDLVRVDLPMGDSGAWSLTPWKGGNGVVTRTEEPSEQGQQRDEAEGTEDAWLMVR